MTKRKAEEVILSEPSSKKQRINGHENENEQKNNKAPAINMSAWGIASDDDSDFEESPQKVIDNNQTNDTNNIKNEEKSNTNGTDNINNNNNTNNTNDQKPIYSGFAKKLMAQMGYKEGASLGKNGNTGIKEPISAFERISHRGGLGFDQILELKPQKHTYEKFDICIEVKPVYCPSLSPEFDAYSESQMDEWLSLSKKVETVGVEWNGTFCDIELQKKLFATKSKFDAIGRTSMFVEARNKANPFEGIKREIFQNRAALKMAEMDRLLDFRITQPKSCRTFNKKCAEYQFETMTQWKSGDLNSISLQSPDLWARELLYFADMCSGPGGFTEYFLHCNTWQCRGFGFTLRGNEDFKFSKFNSNAPWDNFTAHYGSENNGDITLNLNIRSFRNAVLSVVSEGCHVVMADGGFDCFPDYNSQELLSRRLILCQFLGAISILRKGGIFVCKLFDTFHPFTASLIYVMRMCFNEIALIKPNQSRPANSERYLICEGYKFANGSNYFVELLFSANMLITECKKELFLSPLVPIDKMDKGFIDWLRSFNEDMIKKQTKHLDRIEKYLEDRNMKMDDQSAIRRKALKYWFETQDGKPKLILDPNFGSRFVTKYEDYNLDYDCVSRPLNTLILSDPSKCVYGKELYRRISFEANHCTKWITNARAMDEDFVKYKLRGNWFVIAFAFNQSVNDCPPKWVTLVSTGNRQIFECKRDEQLSCVKKTNDQMRLPADTVVDCIKVVENGKEIYHIWDAWCIGSKPIYKRTFIQRQEFCRVLYQGYGSRFIKFAGAMPALQSISRNELISRKNDLFLWFVRNKKSVENKKHNKNPNDPSQYWRPCAIKLWCANRYKRDCMDFDYLLGQLRHIDQTQRQKH